VSNIKCKTSLFYYNKNAESQKVINQQYIDILMCIKCSFYFFSESILGANFEYFAFLNEYDDNENDKWRFILYIRVF